jgi:hypothetical protein
MINWRLNLITWSKDMTEANPYQTPQSNLQEQQPVHYQINPNWDIGDVFKEAWQLISGYKATLWGAMLIYIAISIVVSLPFEFIGKESIIVMIVSQIVVGLVTYPLYAGITILGIKRSVGAATNAFMVFDYYSKIIPIFLLYVAMMLLIGLGLVLLIIPGIYLAVAYSMAIPLLVEKNMGIWEALETSRKAIHKCWFKMFGLYLVILVVVLLALLPLGIGLIWAVPLVNVVMGVVYRNLFSVGQNV